MKITGKALAVLVGVGLFGIVIAMRAGDPPKDVVVMDSADRPAASPRPLRAPAAVPGSPGSRSLETPAGIRQPASNAKRDYAMPRPKSEWELTRERTISAPWSLPVFKSQSSSRPDRLPKIAYLTFDDGPLATWTPQVLSLLKQYGAHATFFQLGEARQNFPDLAEQVVAEGHTIGNHSTTHRSMTSLSDSGVRAELSHGVESKCFRPPYGATNRQVDSVIRAFGMRSVLWDVDSLDWQKPGPDRIAATILKQTRPGSIILMHDGGGERAQTVQALAKVLATLSARGYSFHALPC